MLNLETIKKSVVGNFEYFMERVKDVTPPNDLFVMTEDMMRSRIEDLTIEKASIFDKTVEDYQYNGLTNTIIVNKKYLARDDIFLENLYMDMALMVALYNPERKISGFGTENFWALNKGIREMLALSLVDQGRSTEYFESDEYVYANLVSLMIDPLDLQLAYYRNDPEIFVEKMNPILSQEFGKFHKINMLANYNMKARLWEKSNSKLAPIESELFELFLSTNPAKGQVERFLADTVTSSLVFKEPEKYKRLDALDLDSMYEDYIENMQPGKTY